MVVSVALLMLSRSRRECWISLLKPASDGDADPVALARNTDCKPLATSAHSLSRLTGRLHVPHSLLRKVNMCIKDCIHDLDTDNNDVQTQIVSCSSLCSHHNAVLLPEDALQPARQAQACCPKLIN